MHSENTPATRPSTPWPPTRVSPCWRAGTDALILLLDSGVATAMSLLAQFQAQTKHLQTPLLQAVLARPIAGLLQAKGDSDGSTKPRVRCLFQRALIQKAL